MVGSVDQIEIAFEMFRRKPAPEENLPLTVSEDPTGVEPVGYRTIDCDPEGESANPRGESDRIEGKSYFRTSTEYWERNLARLCECEVYLVIS